MSARQEKSEERDDTRAFSMLGELCVHIEDVIIGILVGGIGILVAGMLEGVRIRPYNNW